MAKRIVLTGYTVVPQLGVLDDETDEVTAVPFGAMQVAAGGLAQFESVEWPPQLADVRKEFSKALKAQDDAQRDAEALVAVATEPKPPRAARRSRPAKKAAPRKRAPARKK